LLRAGNPEKDFLRAELDRIGPRTPICAATFSVALLPSNSPFSKPPTPTEPDIDVFDGVKAPSHGGTEGSNPIPSSAESVANFFGAWADTKATTTRDRGLRREIGP
jgi:hypothetical protein